MPSKLVIDLQGAERMTSDMAPKPTFRRGNSENLLRVAPALCRMRPSFNYRSVV